MTAQPWWKTAVGYQVYPRSFCDSNGDGVGDLPGIASKLDYLAELGIGFIWLSPVYASPMADNGYDISDYRAIAPVFGTMDDFDSLLAQASARGIRIVMDLVVNHTSDQHAWFREAKLGRSAKYHDFYIWRDPAPDGGPPNNMKSTFGGPAWTFSPETGQYYFHLFAPAQPDLNWANPALRAEVYDMMNWWLDKGVAGFRMDVIDLIGKDPDAGIAADGPTLFAHLAEMQRAALAGRDVVTVGEAWSARPDNALAYCGADGPLSMVFQFAHVLEGWDATFGKWKATPRNLPALKRVFDTWQAALAQDGWNSLFWSNHDLPRAVSKYGDTRHRAHSAMALATVLHMMKGTPYIYQGEELGMTNTTFPTRAAFNDLEVHGAWPEMQALGLGEADFLAGANANGRDNARTPMQWSAAPQAGFTTGTPWLPVNPNHKTINAAQRHTPPSVFAHYQRLIRLRQHHPILTNGDHRPLLPDDPDIWAYTRHWQGQRLTVLANLSSETRQIALPEAGQISGQCLSHTHAPRPALGAHPAFAPWEAVAILAST